MPWSPPGLDISSPEKVVRSSDGSDAIVGTPVCASNVVGAIFSDEAKDVDIPSHEVSGASKCQRLTDKMYSYA
jgi:hypothetical protein